MTEAQQLSDTEAKGIAEAEAVEASIQPGQYPVMGISSIRAWQLVNYFKAYGSTYPAEVLTQGGAPDIETFAQMYYEEATAEGGPSGGCICTGDEGDRLAAVWWGYADHPV